MINDFENRIKVYIRVSVGREERFGECTWKSREIRTSIIKEKESFESHRYTADVYAFMENIKMQKCT